MISYKCIPIKQTRIFCNCFFVLEREKKQGNFFLIGFLVRCGVYTKILLVSRPSDLYKGKLVQ